MVATIDWTKDARDRVHNLDLEGVRQQKIIFKEYLYKFILANEGSRAKVYYDTHGKRTIGIGFNMDASGAENAWNQVFNNSIPFYQVRDGKYRALNQAEIEKLFAYSLDKRMESIINLYKEAWEKFKPNERIAIIDAYFNGGNALVGSKTNFYKNIIKYTTTNDPKYLYEAVKEIRDNSNPKDEVGIQNRRNVQAVMLSSYDCPIYSKPNDPPIPKLTEQSIDVHLGQTILPFDHYEHSFSNYLRWGITPVSYYDTYESKTHYIWRTKCDEKVRSSHLQNEGKLFSIDSSPLTGHLREGFNCRCQADYSIPKFANIIEDNQCYDALKPSAILYKPAPSSLQPQVDRMG